MIQQIVDFKNFIYTQYFSDGVKITLGVLLPSLLFFQFGYLVIGITISLGALCTSIADTPGPWLHRKNGMLYGIVLVFLTSLLTGYINGFEILLAIEIFVLCFVFAMFNVYGDRAAAVGSSALLVMVLNINPHQSVIDLNFVQHSLLILSGGVWYFLLSTLFSSLRPYRYAQQTLGESITEVSKYLRLRAKFYNPNFLVEDVYKELVNQQVKVTQIQDNAREALFKTRKLMNESTTAGRLMVRIFVDTIDLFEQAMATNNDYDSIRIKFKDKDILATFAHTVTLIASEVDYIGYCLIHQEKPKKTFVTIQDLDKLKAQIDQLEKEGEQVLILKRILINLRNIYQQVKEIINYFHKETKDIEPGKSNIELSKFVSHQSFSFKAFKNNINFKSAVFRFSLRLAIVCLLGFFIGKLFTLGNHSYWILLTILVIMKPGFSNTKQRNYERVFGTIIGGILGAFILAFVQDETTKFIFLLFFMLITFSFLRIKYFVAVIFMTPFILILFSFINATNNTTTLASERVLDTLIGSALAFAFSYLILPSWESLQFKNNLTAILKANLNYLEHIVLRKSLTPISDTEYKLARKLVYVNSANVAAAFQRLLNEPKKQQKNIDEVLKFVVLNHILSSYLANLSIYFREDQSPIDSTQLKLIRKSRLYLEEAVEKVDKETIGATKNKLHIHLSPGKSPAYITEHLEQISKLSADISRISEKLD
jgi:uncharacterized membrane protein (TIGR01666 family)